MPDSSEIQKKILSGRGLAVERGERILFSGLDFDIEAGTLWQVAGHNGCGKTTLLRGLIGLSSSVQGELFWRGQPVARCRPQMFADCLYFGHHPAVKLMLSARENLQWWQALYEQRDDAAIDLALEQLGLFGYQEVLCGNMSAGQ